MPTTALNNVRVFDGTRLTEPQTVAFDSVLGMDPAGAETIDGAGATLLPGLFDAHVHLNSSAELDQLAEHGITTALDMACWPQQKVDSFRGRVPDIRSAGLPAIGPGGPHSQMPGMPSEAILTDPAQAEQFVARRVAEASDYIKVVVDGQRLSQTVIDAVVAAGQAHGKQAVAHASSLDSFRRAVQAGADIITHAPRDGVLDPETIAQMVQQRQVSVPTLAMMEAIIDAFALPGEDYAYSRDSVAALHAAGVPICAGTDAFAGAVPIPKPVIHGPSLHHELELLVHAGLTNTEALRAATTLPAQHFELTDRGEIRPGLRADLLLVDDDPLSDITATRSIQRIWSTGNEITNRT